jgi:hypothetical protein
MSVITEALQGLAEDEKSLSRIADAAQREYL